MQSLLGGSGRQWRRMRLFARRAKGAAGYIILACLLQTIDNKADTLIGWGSNTSGQVNIPSEATNIVTIAAGDHHSLAVRADGVVLSWGDNAYGETIVPASASNVIAVAASNNDSLALRSDGVVLQWGKNDYPVPDEATNVVAIAAGPSHKLALCGDGSVVAWGSNTIGQTDVPLAATNIVAIAAGTDHSVALRSDGMVVAWGRSNACSVTNAPRMPVAIAGGRSSTYGILPDGAMRCWGIGQVPFTTKASFVSIATRDNNFIALKPDGTISALRSGAITNVPTEAVNVTEIAIGESHALALLGDGTPRIIGPIQYHQIASAGAPLPLAVRAVGSSPLSYQWFRNGVPLEGGSTRVPTVPALLGSDGDEFQVLVYNDKGAVISPVAKVSLRPIHFWGNAANQKGHVPLSVYDPIAVAAGGFHSLALQPDGTVVGWGKNVDGQATPPPELSDVVAVAAGGDHSLALRDNGSVIAWGRNWDGQTSVPSSATNVVAISAGSAHSLALRGDGTLLAWGNNDFGQGIVSFLATEVNEIACGDYHNLALRADGRVVTWGIENETPPSATNVTAIAAGHAHSLALRADGSVVAWGDNSYGQSSVPDSATNVVAIAAGYFHSLALREDGSVVAWGKDFFGSCDYTRFLSGIRTVAAGEEHSLAIVDSGTVRFGPGLKSVTTSVGGRTRIDIAVQAPLAARFQWMRDDEPVAGATNRVLVLQRTAEADAGEYHLVVSTDSGQATGPPTLLVVAPMPIVSSAVGAWGDDLNHQCIIPQTAINPRAIAAGGFHGLALLNDGTVVAWGKARDGRTIVPLSATNVVAIAAGGNHSLALKDDGSVIAWGRNWDGQATPPSSASNIVAISAGWAHSVALRADGSLLAWGNNEYGQLNVPPSASNVISIVSGHFHTLALRSDRTLVSWGWETSVPEQATNVVAIAAGFGHSLAVRADGTLVAWGDNAFGQIDVPPEATNLVAVAAGFYHSLALREDGSVIAWGKGYYGVTTVPANLRYVASIAAGEDFNLALTQTGPPQLGPITGLATCYIGGETILAAHKSGTYPLHFQWFHNGIPLSGETNAYLQLTKLVLSSAGSYTLRAWNSAGTTDSAELQLTVLPTPFIFALDGHLVMTNFVEYSGPASVSIMNPFESGWAVYTADGSDPSINGLPYDRPFTIYSSCLLRCLISNADSSEAFTAMELHVLILPFYDRFNLIADTLGGGSVAIHHATGLLPANSVVEVTATPDPGWTFLCWTGDSEEVAPIISVRMTQDKVVRAVFGTRIQSTVVGRGTVQLWPTLAFYPFGSQVRATAIPDSGQYFLVWAYAENSSQNPTNLTVMSPSQPLVAVFGELGTNSFTIRTTIEGLGEVSLTPHANRYARGQTVALVPHPAPVQQFLGWSGDASGREDPRIVTMDRNLQITANFSRWPELRLVPSAASFQTDHIRLLIDGAPGDIFEVQSSKDLSEWLQISVITNWSGTAQFSPPMEILPNLKFFRVLVQP